MKANIIKTILYTGAFIMLVMVCTSSCKKLDEYNPAGVSEENVLRNYTGWKAFQSNIYSGLWGSLIGMQYGVVSEAGTDLWTFPYNNKVNFKELLAYDALTVDQGLVRNTWDFAWGSIKDCNKTIQLSTQLVDGKASDIKTLVAEAKMMRGYYYSVLVSQFGSLPLVLTDDPVKNLSPKRDSVSKIYAQIVSDLRAAFDSLPVTPFENNPQRVTKKGALGLLARVYAQGGGEGLNEGTKSYWLRAKEVADSLINNMAVYGAAMYDDFGKVFTAANNRDNAEVLFTAYGLNPYSLSYNSFTGNSKPNFYLHFYPKLDDAFGTADLFKRSVNSNSSNAYYGRLNQQFIAPTKYLVNCFDARFDKRWENTFVTAFANYSGAQAIASGATSAPGANVTYAAATITLTPAICTKYGIDASHVNEKIYPYADVDAKLSPSFATWQFSPRIWPKGVYTGLTTSLLNAANANVHPYPLAADEDRFFVYLSKDPLTAADKKLRRYVSINIDDLFDPADPTGSTYKSVVTTNGFTPNSLANLFPSMMKFNHNFDGGWLGGNFQQKLGNIMVMRMAEVYLIAAEATLNTTNDAATAAQYLNVLRKRACRNPADYSIGTGMQLTVATKNDVFDEFARELCGEYNRWALLKREKAFETRLQAYNNTAFVNFAAAKHYNRPIPSTFLNQINNAAEFGTNGY